VDDDGMEELEATGELDAHTAEALRLQIRRLARQHGIELGEVTVRREDEPGSA
jgi:hypothetical protein